MLYFQHNSNYSSVLIGINLVEPSTHLQSIRILVWFRKNWTLQITDSILPKYSQHISYNIRWPAKATFLCSTIDIKTHNHVEDKHQNALSPVHSIIQQLSNCHIATCHKTTGLPSQLHYTQNHRYINYSKRSKFTSLHTWKTLVHANTWWRMWSTTTTAITVCGDKWVLQRQQRSAIATQSTAPSSIKIKWNSILAVC